MKLCRCSCYQCRRPTPHPSSPKPTPATRGHSQDNEAAATHPHTTFLRYVTACKGCPIVTSSLLTTALIQQVAQMSLFTAIRPGTACVWAKGSTNGDCTAESRADAEAAALQHSWGTGAQMLGAVPAAAVHSLHLTGCIRSQLQLWRCCGRSMCTVSAFMDACSCLTLGRPGPHCFYHAPGASRYARLCSDMPVCARCPSGPGARGCAVMPAGHEPLESCCSCSLPKAL